MSAAELGGTNGGGKPVSEWAGVVEKARRVSVVDMADSIRGSAFDLCGSDYLDWLKAGLAVRENCLHCGRHGADRTVVQAFTKLVVEAGRSRDMVDEVSKMLGGVAISRALGAVESLERAGLKSPRQRAEIHAKALREMGWTVEPPADWSEAEVVNGNGGPHV